MAYLCMLLKYVYKRPPHGEYITENERVLQRIRQDGSAAFCVPSGLIAFKRGLQRANCLIEPSSRQKEVENLALFRRGTDRVGP